LENGDIIQGDVVIGADGVRSATRRAIGGPEYDSFGIGKSAIRFMVPRDKVLADPETRELAEVDGAMDLIFAQEHKVIIYQCVNNTLLNIVCIHPAHQSSASTETYNKSVSKERLLDIFHEFAPKLLKLFEKCDSDTLKVYPLFDAKTMPTFVKDRLALIGDAAHPFTPFIGQGGATAIEDAVSIGVVLSQGTTVAEVPAKLELYNKARYERATKIQGYSRMAGGDGVKPGEEKAAQMKGKFRSLYSVCCSCADGLRS
jgi:2-polyprenyl-6-methoxyphenol hydroxylase-like FAD-dependent oxidoreductase